MKIRVISLSDACERRDYISAQLNSRNLEFQFFNALTGNDGYEPYFAAYSRSHYLLNTGRLAAPGEIGCYASHRALWKQCVSFKEPILIAEDDAVFSDRFSSAINQVGGLIESYGFIRLETVERHSRQWKLRMNGHQLIEECGEFGIHYVSRMSLCATCYAISPIVAAAFLSKSQVLTEPVDKFMQKNWVHKQPLYALVPPVARQDGFSVFSSIEAGRASAMKLPLIGIPRFFFKAKEKIRRFAFNLTHERLKEAPSSARLSAAR